MEKNWKIKFCKKNAKIRYVKILKNILLHRKIMQQTMKEPNIKPKRMFIGSRDCRNKKKR